VETFCKELVYESTRHATRNNARRHNMLNYTTNNTQHSSTWGAMAVENKQTTVTSATTARYDNKITTYNNITTIYYKIVKLISTVTQSNAHRRTTLVTYKSKQITHLVSREDDVITYTETCRRVNILSVSYFNNLCFMCTCR
jgi:RNase P/RNase MRP subunit p30